MPFIEDDPPKPFPRGQINDLPNKFCSGSELNPQLYFFIFIGYDRAAGISMNIDLFCPPYSINRTFILFSCANLYAIAEPEEPAPTTM